MQLATAARRLRRLHSTGARATVLVEGRRSVDQVVSEAVARRSEPIQFVMCPASGDELEAAGLQPAGETASQGASRVGIRLKMERGDSPGALPEPLKVSQRSNLDFIPLAKAVATELRWMPAGEVLAVESLLVGKAKNVWTRTFNLARAVAQVYSWQVDPARPSAALRPFRCVALERAVDLELAPAEGAAPGGAAAAPAALRLVLLAEGQPPARADGSPGVRHRTDA